MQSPNTRLLLQPHRPPRLLLQPLVCQIHISIHLINQPHVRIGLLVNQIRLVLETTHTHGEFVNHIILLAKSGGGGRFPPAATASGSTPLGRKLTLQSVQ